MLRGVMLFGVMLCGVVWFGVVWYGLLFCGVVWCVFDYEVLFSTVCIVFVWIEDTCVLDDCRSCSIRVGEEYVDGFSIVFCGVV